MLIVLGAASLRIGREGQWGNSTEEGKIAMDDIWLYLDALEGFCVVPDWFVVSSEEVRRIIDGS